MTFVTKNHVEVSLYSEFAAHMAAHPDVKMEDIAEAVSKVEYNGAFFMAPIDLGHVVGVNHLIRRPADEKVQYLYRKSRDGRTPVVFDQTPEPTSKIVVGIAHDDGRDVLFTAFYGELSPREPWDESLKGDEAALKESQDFWAQHCLIATSDQIDWSRS